MKIVDVFPVEANDRAEVAHILIMGAYLGGMVYMWLSGEENASLVACTLAILMRIEQLSYRIKSRQKQ